MHAKGMAETTKQTTGHLVLGTCSGTREKNVNNNTMDETYKYFRVNLGHVKGPFQLNNIIIINNS